MIIESIVLGITLVTLGSLVFANRNANIEAELKKKDLELEEQYLKAQKEEAERPFKEKLKLEEKEQAEKIRLEKEIREEKNRLEKKIEAEKLKEEEKIKEEEEKKNPKPPREDKIILVKNAHGELTVCPLCECTRDKSHKYVPTGMTCKMYLDKNEKSKMRNHDWSVGTTQGASAPVAVITSNGPRIWQACTRCCGEWLTMPVSLKDKKV